MLDDPEEKFKELKEKLEDIDARIDELEESEETIEPEEGFLQIHGSSDQFFLHWIDISETSYSECEDVDSVEKAQKAFKEAAEYREDSENDKRGILHGDVMVLLCNSAKEEDQESGEITYTDSCYYAGMCIITDGLMQEENPVSDIKIGASIEEDGETVKQFIAWDTCGGESCPEDPDTIQFDELKPPESGGGDEDLKGIEIAQPFGSSTLLAKLHELETLTFTKKEGEGGENPEPDPIEYVMFKDGDPFNAGALFEFSNIINEADDGYDVEAGVMQVSLYSASGKIKEVNYKAKTYDLKTVSISSDSCGMLKREDAEDENGEPIKESVKFISKVEGSEPTHYLSSLRAEAGSATVSLGTFDLSSLMVTEDNFENGHFFVPKIDETGATLKQVCRDIETKSEIQLLKDFKIDVVQTAEGDNCTKITITPKTKKETFTFHSGLLTDKTDDDTWVSGTATSFIVGKCSSEDGCRDAELGDLFFSTVTRYSGSPGNWTLYRSYNYSNPILLNGSAVYNNLTIRDASGNVLFTGTRGDVGFVNTSVFNGKNANDDCEIHISTDLHSSDIPRSSLINGELIKTGEKLVFS
jgi:hypothetical protein